MTDETCRQCTALVLAAGLSRRAGADNKLLWGLDGKSLVERVVRAALESSVGSVHVVTGHEADAVREALSGLPVTFVHCADYEEGMGRSLAAGVASLPEGCRGVVVPSS